jgi:putative tricarboxylic transport membrane protein
MEDTPDKSSDWVSGLALAALGFYVIVEASRWEYLGADGPGPGFFPMGYGIAIVALSAVLVVSSLGSKLRREGAATRTEWNRIGRALLAWLALAASVALFEPLGFVLSFGLLTFFIVAVMYRRPLKVAAAVAVASAVGFYLVFPLALGVSLPVGALGF